LEGLRIEAVGTFDGRFEYFTAIWYILWPLGNVVVIWYVFPRFGILCEEKSGNAAQNTSRQIHLTSHSTCSERKL
jgi:hypothetical protein